jgi:hypothetical protein
MTKAEREASRRRYEQQREDWRAETRRNKTEQAALKVLAAQHPEEFAEVFAGAGMVRGPRTPGPGGLHRGHPVAWAMATGMSVSDRDRLRPEVWANEALMTMFSVQLPESLLCWAMGEKVAMGGGGQHDEGAAFRIEDGMPCIGEHSFPGACRVVEQDPWAGFFLMFENGWGAGLLWRVDGQRPCGGTANVFGWWQHDWPEVDLDYGYWGGRPPEPLWAR